MLFQIGWAIEAIFLGNDQRVGARIESSPVLIDSCDIVDAAIKPSQFSVSLIDPDRPVVSVVPLGCDEIRRTHQFTLGQNDIALDLTALRRIVSMEQPHAKLTICIERFSVDSGKLDNPSLISCTIRSGGWTVI